MLMEIVKILSVDYEKMGDKIADLRRDNMALRRYVCFYKQQYDGGDGEGEICTCDKCDSCADPLESLVSQEELGRVLGESKYVVASWETGRTSPDVQHLIAICAICKLDMGEFVRSCSVALKPE